MDNFKNLTEWSMAVRARDGCCRRCRGTLALVAHHIRPKSLHPDLRLVLSNGETLCSNCHAEHHKNDPGVQSAAKRAAKKAKIALLRDENSALKQEVAAVLAELDECRRRLSEYMGASDEIAGLKRQLAEYEEAYEKLTAWDVG